MIEGKVDIYLSYKEPIHKDRTLWLRPYLDREGYELLFYGTRGWTPLSYTISISGISNNGKLESIPSIDNSKEECKEYIEDCSCKN